MTDAEVGAGLVLPYVASAVAGQGGAVAILLIIFMVTSGSSSFGVALTCFDRLAHLSPLPS
jgi:Na+/proline symporter